MSILEQVDKIKELKAKGYVWDKTKSNKQGLVLSKPKSEKEDFYFIGLMGEFKHNEIG